MDPKPRFRWTMMDYGTTWQLREVGESFAFASVYRLSVTTPNGAKKAGYPYSVYVMGSRVGMARDLEAAKAMAGDVSEEARATKHLLALKQAS